MIRGFARWSEELKRGANKAKIMVTEDKFKTIRANCMEKALTQGVQLFPDNKDYYVSVGEPFFDRRLPIRQLTFWATKHGEYISKDILYDLKFSDRRGGTIDGKIKVGARMGREFVLHKNWFQRKRQDASWESCTFDDAGNIVTLDALDGRFRPKDMKFTLGTMKLGVRGRRDDETKKEDLMYVCCVEDDCRSVDAPKSTETVAGVVEDASAEGDADEASEDEAAKPTPHGMYMSPQDLRPVLITNGGNVSVEECEVDEECMKPISLPPEDSEPLNRAAASTDILFEFTILQVDHMFELFGIPRSAAAKGTIERISALVWKHQAGRVLCDTAITE